MDRYRSKLFFSLVLILGLNIFDVLSTKWKFNRIVQSVMDIYGNRFWIWKFAIISVSLILLCFHSKFRSVKQIIMSLSLIYLLIILYQLFVFFRL